MSLSCLLVPSFFRLFPSDGSATSPPMHSKSVLLLVWSSEGRVTLYLNCAYVPCGGHLFLSRMELMTDSLSAKSPYTVLGLFPPPPNSGVGLVFFRMFRRIGQETPQMLVHAVLGPLVCFFFFCDVRLVSVSLLRVCPPRVILCL